MFGDNFLLTTDTAVKLFNGYADGAPIYDFHCHLPAREIYEDKQFPDICNMWLQFDHYKWRALRYAGVPEKYITGDAQPFEKFEKWAYVYERLAGCPLNQWGGMELDRYFGIKEPLSSANARSIFDQCNRVISEKHLSPRKLLEDSGVRLVCTTDDPIDDLRWHRQFASSGASFEMRPTFRPDKALDIANTSVWIKYISALGAASEIKISSFSALQKALCARLDYFVANGCLITDHALGSLMVTEFSEEKASAIFDRALLGETLTPAQAELFRNTILRFLGREYSSRKLVMQLHIGAARNCNTKMFNKLGPDTGYDIMDDFDVMQPIKHLLDSLDMDGRLPKTILYCLNQKDTHVLASLPQCYCEDDVPGKLQCGVPWWHLDNKYGIEYHLQTLSNEGMLADFIGMLTDSRSFLSYVRHEYFRRMLCRYLGEIIENGEYPVTVEHAGAIVRGICCDNIKNYLGL